MNAPFHFACFACGLEMAAAPEHQGRGMKCPRCGVQITIPMDKGRVDPWPKPEGYQLGALVPSNYWQRQRLAEGLETHQARSLMILVGQALATLTLAIWTFPRVFQPGGCILDTGLWIIGGCSIFYLPLFVAAVLIIGIYGNRRCACSLQAPPLALMARLAHWLDVGALALLGSALLLGLFGIFPGWLRRGGEGFAWLMMSLSLLGTLCWFAGEILFFVFLQRLALALNDDASARRAVGLGVGWATCAVGAAACAVLTIFRAGFLGNWPSQLLGMVGVAVGVGWMVDYVLLYCLLGKLRQSATRSGDRPFSI